MDFTWEDYKKKLETYRKNRENVPLETLKTKYAAGYNKLIADLKKMTEDVLREVILTGMVFIPDDFHGESEKFIDTMNRIVYAEAQSGTIKEIGNAVFREYDAEKMLYIAVDRLWTPAWYQAYAPYWVSKCMEDKDGVIRCDLLPGFWWDRNTGIWMKEDNGTWSFTDMLPPSMELVRKEQDDMKCHRIQL